MQQADVDGIVALAAELVRLPSRAGADSPEPVLRALGRWLAAHGLEPRSLTSDAGETVGLCVRVMGPEAGPILCLDACIDTAPFGDPARWSRPPTSGAIDNGRLWGRGAADSKMGAAILAHVVRDLVATGAIRRGGVDLLLDADEHTGRFGGARAYLAALDRRPDGAVLGYPGNHELIRGSRGFHRVRLAVSGRAGHSGSTDGDGINAIGKLARLITALEEAELPLEPPGPFAFGPRVTVTRIEGGEGFSMVPDRAVCSLDMRLTPGFGIEQASRWLDAIAARHDAHIEPVESWPPYLVPESHPLVRSFQSAGALAWGRDVPLAVCGPSNIGNLLAAHGIPTLCGLGVTAENVHGTDECALLASVDGAWRGYLEGARRFLAA
ncbi:MAG: M20/M25/M40 family metallo-hydrolase [Alphaproteobacteria bacterium]|nr:M20/M25/M40 family metallo-hydrolase [Alphaproteobacteria bacterium]